MSVVFCTKRNSDFAEGINLPKYPLDDAVEWIRGNLDPEEVFEWEILKDRITWMYPVDEVFSKEQLETWAEENGFVKGE